MKSYQGTQHKSVAVFLIGASGHRLSLGFFANYVGTQTHTLCINLISSATKLKIKEFHFCYKLCCTLIKIFDVLKEGMIFKIQIKLVGVVYAFIAKIIFLMFFSH